MLPKQRDELLARILREFPLGSLSQDEAQAWIGDPLFETHLAEVLSANAPKTGKESMVLDCSRSFDSGKLEILADNFVFSPNLNLSDYDSRMADKRADGLPSKIDFQFVQVSGSFGYYFGDDAVLSPGWSFVGSVVTNKFIVPLCLNHFLALVIDYQSKSNGSVLQYFFSKGNFNYLYFLGQTFVAKTGNYVMRISRCGIKKDCFSFEFVSLNDMLEISGVHYLGIDSQRVANWTSHYKRGPGLEHTIK